jgi:hypothetical protein
MSAVAERLKRVTEQKQELHAEARAIVETLNETRSIEEVVDALDALEIRLYDVVEEEEALDLKLEEEGVTS